MAGTLAASVGDRELVGGQEDRVGDTEDVAQGRHRQLSKLFTVILASVDPVVVSLVRGAGSGVLPSQGAQSVELAGGELRAVR